MGNTDLSIIKGKENFIIKTNDNLLPKGINIVNVTIIYLISNIKIFVRNGFKRDTDVDQLWLFVDERVELV